MCKFTLTYTRNYSELAQRARQITHSQEWRDILHDSYLKMMEKFTLNKKIEWETDDEFIGIMYREIQWTWYNYFNRDRKIFKNSAGGEMLDVLVAPNDEDDLNEMTFSQDSIINAINLEPNERHKNVMLLLMGGHDHESIQNKLGTSTVNTRSIIFEARKKLYQRLFKTDYSKKKKSVSYGQRKASIKTDSAEIYNAYPFNGTWVDRIKFILTQGPLTNTLLLAVMRANERNHFNQRIGYKPALDSLRYSKQVKKDCNGILSLTGQSIQRQVKKRPTVCQKRRIENSVLCSL